MSELREIEIPVDDGAFQQTARELGMAIERDTFIRGYATRNIKGRMVARHKYGDVGIVGNKLVYDNLAKEADTFLSTYMDKYITRKLGGTRLEKKETKTQVVYTARI